LARGRAIGQNRRVARAASPASRIRSPGAAVCAAFLLLSLWWLPDFGLTTDEWVTYRAARANLEALSSGSWDFESSEHEIPGYYFVLDTARALFEVATRPLFGDPVPAYHLFHALLSTGALALLYGLVLELSGSRRFAAFAALSLALLPQFVAHSQNNPKDLPALFAFVAIAYAVAKVTFSPKRRYLLLASGLLGLGLTTRINVVFAPVILAAWLVACQRRALREGIARYALVLAGGAAFGFAFWPAAWDDPIGDLLAAIRHVTSFSVSFPVLYLGRPWASTDLPWHYFLVNLLVSIPLSLLALLLPVPIALRRWRREDRPAYSALVLGLAWVGVLLAAEGLSASHYDGIRHFLAILPGLAIAMAAGCELATRWLESRRGPWRARWGSRPEWSVAALCYGSAFVGLLAIHPHPSAYLNPVARAAIPGPPERWLELEYWGHAYKEGARWLNENAEAGAEIWLPMAVNAEVARYYLERESVVGIDERFFDASRPRYAMFITRRAFYPVGLEPVRRRCPLAWSIRAGGATLLEIRDNRGCQRGGRGRADGPSRSGRSDAPE
jgi:4-amino-4-deoxy-L-arabinose transferase-like glycosyltransferase